MMRLYRFTSGGTTIIGDAEDMISFATHCRDAEGTMGDLRYMVEYAFDIDGVRSSNYDDPDHGDIHYADRYLMNS